MSTRVIDLRYRATKLTGISRKRLLDMFRKVVNENDFVYAFNTAIKYARIKEKDDLHHLYTRNRIDDFCELVAEIIIRDFK